MRYFFLLTLLLSFLHAEQDVKKVVYDLTTSDIGAFKQKLLSGVANNKGYYEGKLQELEVAVVIHGDAYKFFIEDLKNSAYKDEKNLFAQQKELKARIESLATNYHVEFLMCGSGMKKIQLTKEQIYPFIKIVPNASIGLIDKQNEGYAYFSIAH